MIIHIRKCNSMNLCQADNVVFWNFFLLLLLNNKKLEFQSKKKNRYGVRIKLVQIHLFLLLYVLHEINYSEKNMILLIDYIYRYKYIFFISMGVKYVDNVSLSLLYCYLQIYFCCVAFMIPLNLSSRSCSIAFLKN